MAYASQFKDYEEKLKEFKKQCEIAEKDKITAEANLKIFEEQKEKLINECEQYAGITIDEIPAMLEKEVIELENIMRELNAIDFTTSAVTEEDVEKIEAIMQKYGIEKAEE